MKTTNQFQNRATGTNQSNKTAKTIYKKIVFFAFMVFGVSLQTGFNPCKAQGNNLQFSRVILVGASAQTVPANTVWKIENILPNTALMAVPSQNSSTTINCSISINGTAVYVYTGIAAFNNSTSNGNINGSSNYAVTGMWAYANGIAANSGEILKSPIWLPATSTLAASTNVFAISVIEFNIVP